MLLFLASNHAVKQTDKKIRCECAIQPCTQLIQLIHRVHKSQMVFATFKERSQISIKKACRCYGEEVEDNSQVGDPARQRMLRAWLSKSHNQKCATSDATSSCGDIPYRFRDRRRFQLKIAKKNSHPLYFASPLKGFPLKLGIGAGVKN